jgi:hypothetical protein
MHLTQPAIHAIARHGRMSMSVTYPLWPVEWLSRSCWLSVLALVSSGIYRYHDVMIAVLAYKVEANYTEQYAVLSALSR